MKKQTLMLFSFALILTGAGNIYSQCIPDTVTCRDTLMPGQICPEILPDGYIGETYNQTVTVLPPSMALISGIPLTIVKIKIDTITNLPPGLAYTLNAGELYPDTAYCVLLSGIPSETGEFKIAITVIPYIDIVGTVVEGPPVVNDTSVKILIQEQGSIIKTHFNDLYVITYWPNPFSESTKIGFMTDKSSSVSLIIYNITGMPVYCEILQANPGKNYFSFTGENMKSGCYFYSVVNNKNVFTGKLIKAR